MCTMYSPRRSGRGKGHLEHRGDVRAKQFSPGFLQNLVSHSDGPWRSLKDLEFYFSAPRRRSKLIQRLGAETWTVLFINFA